jgi:hypothetical protein
MVLGDEVGRDPEQPGPDGAAGEIESVPAAERGQERLRREAVGRIGSEPAGYVPVNGGEVPGVQPAERLRLAERQGEYLLVRARTEPGTGRGPVPGAASVG